MVDPNFVLPDINSANNIWTPEIASENAENLEGYVGEYKSASFPMSVSITEENGDLVAIAEGQPKLNLSNEGNGKFTFDEAGLEIQFDSEKNGFEMNISGQIFEFEKIN